MSFHRVKRIKGCLKFLQAGEGYVKTGKAMGAWKHSQVQTGVETKAAHRKSTLGGFHAMNKFIFM